MNKTAKKLVALSLAFLTFFSSVTPALAVITYTYDANGNMSSDGTQCYEYNEANQLSKVTNCGSQTIAEFVYDYEGNRIAKKEYENGNLKHTIYSPEKEYEVKKPAAGGEEKTTYVFANDELVARKNTDGSKVYYQNDHLGSATLLTNQSGAVVENTTYYPFGDIRSGGTNSKYLYTGQERDSLVGLNYYNARYYNSHIAHFTQPDRWLPHIYDPQQLNRYSYVRNNPLKYTDPSGNQVALQTAFLSPLFLLGSINPFAVLLGAVALALTHPVTSPIATKALVNSTPPLAIATLAKNTITSMKNSSTASSKSAPQSGSNMSSNQNSSGNTPQNPNKSDNPLQKVAPTLPILSKLGNISGGNSSVNQALQKAEEWLGKGYREIASGVYRSADNLRQFRMTLNDLTSKLPHVHFESVADDGKTIIENSHVGIQ